MITRIFVDLDGVLADFDKRASEIIGKPFKRGSNDIWDELVKYPNLFRDLPLMPDAIPLWQYLVHFWGGKLTILTAVPRRTAMPNAAEDKKYWVKEMLGDVPVVTCFAVEKQRFCSGPETVLIDDNVKNIAQWSSRGGIGIYHVSTEETLSCLDWFRGYHDSFQIR